MGSLLLNALGKVYTRCSTAEKKRPTTGIQNERMLTDHSCLPVLSKKTRGISQNYGSHLNARIHRVLTEHELAFVQIVIQQMRP